MDFLNQTFVVERILIDVDAAPDAGVVCTNRDDAEGRVYALEMLYPQIIRGRLSDDRSLSCLLTIASLRFNSVGAISDVEAAKYGFESGDISHTTLYGRWGRCAQRPLGLERSSVCVGSAFSVLVLDLHFTRVDL